MQHQNIGNKHPDIKETESLAKRTPLPPSDEAEVMNLYYGSSDNGYALARRRVRKLVMWENKVESASALVGSLGLLFLAQRYSPLALICLLGFCFTALNLIYVNIYRRIWEKSPYDETKRDVALDHSRVGRFVSLCVDVVNVLLQESLSIMLVENNKRSIKWAITLYVLWRLSLIMPTYYLLVAFITIGLTLPRLYFDNKELVDQNLARGQSIMQEQYRRASAVTQEKTSQLSHLAVEKASHLTEIGRERVGQLSTITAQKAEQLAGAAQESAGKISTTATEKTNAISEKVKGLMHRNEQHEELDKTKEE
ncbi:uncharacterized protein VTP21DRAFT_5161 [Calcarisporiella thermophila]|uniref:uncharacterized protein n=1 Tax=Calcarisporiella thermophila TaxID=911321 RepID=UPI00374453C8